jgi:flagellar hook-associated protein 1 FlgK
MSDLLSIGRSGVLAYRDALAGVSENVVNANNDGFAKRQVVLKEQTSSSGPMFLYRNSASFNGVQAANVTRVWDQYRAANAWSANSDDARASTRSQYLSTVEQVADDNDSGVGVKLTQIFTTANALASNPGDPALRQSVLYAIQDAAGSLGQTSADLGKISDTVYQQANTTISQVNDAMAALSRVNVSLKTSPPGTSGRAALEDQRDSLIGTISSSLGVDVQLDGYGAASVRLNDYAGPILVTNARDDPALLNLSRASDGRIAATLTSGGNTSPVTITSGTVAGLADVASTIADRRRQLDSIANNLATSLNAWQAQGTDPAGVAGVPLLTGTTAQTLALATTDPQAIAAADATGDNGNLLTLASLRGATGVEAQWHALASDQSLQVAAAKTQASTAATQKDNAYSALDEVSGVDLDAEAADLMRFQQAYTASAKVIQASRETMQEILNLF